MNKKVLVKLASILDNQNKILTKLAQTISFKDGFSDLIFRNCNTEGGAQKKAVKLFNNNYGIKVLKYEVANDQDDLYDASITDRFGNVLHDAPLPEQNYVSEGDVNDFMQEIQKLSSPITKSPFLKLNFKPYNNDMGSVAKANLIFDNGYGVSVLQYGENVKNAYFEVLMTDEKGKLLHEAAPLTPANYTHMSIPQVQDFMKKVEALPKKEVSLGKAVMNYLTRR
jgi:hypothetical protein